MSIPLVQNNEKDSINTSIIAIKRNIERINMLLGLSNSEEIDTSKFATKDELQQAVTDLQPVNEVAVDNMHSVSSNAVAKCLSYSETEVFTGGYWLNGKKIYRKTYKVTFSQLNISTQLPPVVNMQTTIKYWGTAIMKDYIMPIPWTDTVLNTNWFGYINLSSHTKQPYLYIFTSTNNSSPFDVIINVEYTKTTD